jgi:hypothetical protein
LLGLFACSLKDGRTYTLTPVLMPLLSHLLLPLAVYVPCSLLTPERVNLPCKAENPSGRLGSRTGSASCACRPCLARAGTSRIFCYVVLLLHTLDMLCSHVVATCSAIRTPSLTARWSWAEHSRQSLRKALLRYEPDRSPHRFEVACLGAPGSPPSQGCLAT